MKDKKTVTPLAPIFIAELLPKIDQKLIELLKGLSKEEWSAKTISPKWTVKDIAVHLLDGNLRTLSMLRDNYYGEKADNINSYEDLVSFLNQLNADWIKAMKRLSPGVIIDLLEQSGKQYCTYLKNLNPFDKASFPVAWAGEETSDNWFHIAREYTEKWHHQQQIRLAVGLEAALMTDEFFFPYLDTSIRALSYHYRTLQGHNSDLIKFIFEGKSQKVWYLKWLDNQWQLFLTRKEQTTCKVYIKDEIAWQIFTKGISQKEAIKQSKIIGNQQLGKHIFELIAIMG